MCEACDSADREIARLKAFKKRMGKKCGRIPRKEYWDDYYEKNRDAILAKARERYLSRRSLPLPGGPID